MGTTISDLSLHRAFNEFPVLFLLAAPIFVLLGIALKERGRTFLVVALILMVLGTAFLMVAVTTGGKAQLVAPPASEDRSILQEHRQFAENARDTLMVATVVFCSLFLFFRQLHFRVVEVPAGLSIAFLAFYALGIFALLEAARHGLMLAGSNE